MQSLRISTLFFKMAANMAAIVNIVTGLHQWELVGSGVGIPRQGIPKQWWLLQTEFVCANEGLSNGACQNSNAWVG